MVEDRVGDLVATCPDAPRTDSDVKRNSSCVRLRVEGQDTKILSFPAFSCVSREKLRCPVQALEAPRCYLWDLPRSPESAAGICASGIATRGIAARRSRGGQDPIE